MAQMRTLTINGEKFNVTPVVPTSSVTLSAKAWVGDGDTYSQVVELPGVGLHTKVDLQPTPEQLEEFHYLTLGFVAENEGGIVTVYAIGDKPTNDHTIQVTLTEVEADGKIRGNTVGTTIPRADWNQEDPTKADYIKNKPNINDQTPTFEQAPASENIVSGERLSTIFGKVMRAISDQASHSGDTNNPHSVTAQQVGARPDTWMPSAPDVGAAPASHTIDKNNPHAVTADQVGARPDTWLPTLAEIGAAPVGYGLGATNPTMWLRSIEELNSAVASGWYHFYVPNTTINNVGFNHAGVTVHAIENGACVQEMRPLNTNYVLQRYLYNGAWSEWECVNPPMVEGVEYRTTERYKGKPVYAKLKSLGAMPNAATKTFYTLAENVDNLVFAELTLDKGESRCIDNKFTDLKWYIGCYSSPYIEYSCTTDKSAYTGFLLMKYTKTTD